MTSSRSGGLAILAGLGVGLGRGVGRGGRLLLLAGLGVGSRGGEGPVADHRLDLRDGTPGLVGLGAGLRCGLGLGHEDGEDALGRRDGAVGHAHEQLALFVGGTQVHLGQGEDLVLESRVCSLLVVREQAPASVFAGLAVGSGLRHLDFLRLGDCRAGAR